MLELSLITCLTPHSAVQTAPVARYHTVAALLTLAKAARLTLWQDRPGTRREDRPLVSYLFGKLPLPCSSTQKLICLAVGSGDSELKMGGDTSILSGAGYLAGGSVRIRGGSSSNSAGAIDLAAGDASGGQDALGGSVRVLSGSGDVSGTVFVGSGAGSRESEF